MRYEVVLTARAQQDLIAARTYIAQFAPERAERWYVDVLQSLLKLEQSPENRRLAEESEAFPFELREYLHRARSGGVTRALFTIVGQQVRVLAIRRPGQDAVSAEDLA